MSRRDLDRDTVVKALVKDGWTITRGPLTLEYGGRNLYVDLAAAKPVLAQKDGLKIAINDARRTAFLQAQAIFIVTFDRVSE